MSGEKKYQTTGKAISDNLRISMYLCISKTDVLPLEPQGCCTGKAGLWTGLWTEFSVASFQAFTFVRTPISITSKTLAGTAWERPGNEASV